MAVGVAGREIETTEEHPFWVVGRGWTAANKIRVGERVLSASGEQLRVESVGESRREAVVYNFRVEELHTYFVGDPAGWGFDVWVHNNHVATNNLPAQGLVNPNEVNFTQRTMNKNVADYATHMKNGTWDWTRPGSVIRVMEINGKLVTFDNRRVAAARLAGLTEIPYKKVMPTEMYSTNKTWQQAFEKRRVDTRNVNAGGAVPPDGLNALPAITE